MELFDVVIIGAGVAGSVAAYRLKKANEKIKLAIVDVGRPPLKRRRQIEGWLGCLPNSDGKLYTQDLNNLSKFLSKETIDNNFNYYKSLFPESTNFSLTKTKKVSRSLSKELANLNYSIEYSDYYQIFPKDIHQLSKKMSSYVDDTKNTEYFFDVEVLGVEKEGSDFVVKAEDLDIKAKKVIFTPGRSGWRFSKSVYDFFKLEQKNDYSHYGVRAEIDISSLKEFNKSICKLESNDYTLGRFCWNGTTIQEDHIDIAISSFRSNEKRWESNKVSFDILKKVHNPNKGLEESERISKLSFLLANDRVLKEKSTMILSEKAKISPLKEFSWLPNKLKELDNIMPGFSQNANIYYPSILALAPAINIKPNFETDIAGLYTAGENLGEYGILFAAISGIACADAVVGDL